MSASQPEQRIGIVRTAGLWIVRPLSGRYEFLRGFSVWVEKTQLESVSAEGDVLNYTRVLAKGSPAWGKSTFWVSFWLLAQANNFIFANRY